MRFSHISSRGGTAPLRRNPKGDFRQDAESPSGSAALTLPVPPSENTYAFLTHLVERWHSAAPPQPKGGLSAGCRKSQRLRSADLAGATLREHVCASHMSRREVAQRRSAATQRGTFGRMPKVPAAPQR